MECRYVWGAKHEAILKTSPEAQNGFCTKSRTVEVWDNFP